MSTTEELLMKGMLHGHIAGIRKDVSRCAGRVLAAKFSQMLEWCATKLGYLVINDLV